MNLFQNKLYALISIVGGSLPVIYIWSLPYLANLDFAKPGPDPSGIGYSISSYISNAQATGLMAACFYYPCIQMWSDYSLLNYIKNLEMQKKITQHTVSFTSLVVFQTNFGLFLSFPVDKFGLLHAMTVVTFSTSGLIHYYYLIKIGNISKLGKIPLYTSTLRLRTHYHYVYLKFIHRIIIWSFVLGCRMHRINRYVSWTMHWSNLGEI